MKKIVFEDEETINAKDVVFESIPTLILVYDCEIEAAKEDIEGLVGVVAYDDQTDFYVVDGVGTDLYGGFETLEECLVAGNNHGYAFRIK